MSHKHKEPDPIDMPDTPEVVLTIDGRKRSFDIDDRDLPKWLDERALTADFPYDEKMKRKHYEKDLMALQIELVKMQDWMHKSGARVIAVFEGRDAAGKGGTIERIRKYLNPRSARNVALPKPSETERGQWYFQRYVTHLPTTGEFVTFDRSWYNRAGVEPVMGFCTAEEHAQFLEEAPRFENSIVENGIYFFKFWLNIARETQLKRFHARRHSLLKHWKYSPVDVAGLVKWDDYTRMRDLMFERTHTQTAPWTVVKANDKRRARIAVIRRILLSIPYDNRDLAAIGGEDEKIIATADRFAD